LFHVDEVLLDDRHLEALQASDVDLHRLSQPSLRTPRVVVVVQQDVVEEAVADMLDQRLEMLRGRVEAGLAGLRRHVADIGADPLAAPTASRMSLISRFRKDAGVEAPRAHHHQVRL
jgi:hypothetical protein